MIPSSPIGDASGRRRSESFKAPEKRPRFCLVVPPAPDGSPIDRPAGLGDAGGTDDSFRFVEGEAGRLPPGAAPVDHRRVGRSLSISSTHTSIGAWYRPSRPPVSRVDGSARSGARAYDRRLPICLHVVNLYSDARPRPPGEGVAVSGRTSIESNLASWIGPAGPGGHQPLARSGSTPRTMRRPHRGTTCSACFRVPRSTRSAIRSPSPCPRTMGTKPPRRSATSWVTTPGAGTRSKPTRGDRACFPDFAGSSTASFRG